MNNQKISTARGTIILIIIALTVGVFVWKVGKDQEATDQSQSVVSIKKPVTLKTPGTSQQNADLATYQNKDFGFSFNYPADWGDVVVENGNSNSVDTPPCKAPLMMLYARKPYPWGLYSTALKFSKAPIDFEIKLTDLNTPNIPKNVCNVKGEMVTISTIQPTFQNGDLSVINKAGMKFILDPSVVTSINTNIEGPVYETRYKNKLVWIYSGFSPYYNTPEEIELRDYLRRPDCQGANAYTTEKGCGIVAWYQDGEAAQKIHTDFDDVEKIVQSISF